LQPEGARALAAKCAGARCDFAANLLAIALASRLLDR